MANQNNRLFGLVAAFSLLAAASLACNFPTASAVPQQVPSVEAPTAASPAPTRSQAGPVCLNGIQPGKTSRAEAIQILGEPLDASQDSGLEILTYATSDPNQYNTLGIKSDLVTQVSEFVDETSAPAWSEIKQQYGEPEKTVYSYYLPAAMTYLYAGQGMAFVADEDMDLVFIKSCFIPMSIEDYMATLGSTLPLENPFSK